MAATQDILDDFTRKTGIKTKLVAVPEDQLATLMTNAAAAGELPDVVLGTPLDQSQQYAKEGIFDAEAAQEVVDRLGPDTFSKKALDLVSQDGVATGVPSDGWGQLLIYRKDLFDKAGLDAPQSYGDIASKYSVKGAQDVDSTRGTYFAGRAAMMFWSPFLLDGMAGLRNDTKPSCKECKKDPAFLAKNSGLVGPISGPGGDPSQFGVVSTVNISVDAPTEDAQKLAEFMLSDGYVRWLALSPQGKYPVRAGDGEDPKKFEQAWTGLESGVDRKAPLNKFYSQESIDSLAEGVQNFQRWGFAQGEGALIGALRGEQPIAGAVADVIGGKDPAAAAKDVQSTVEETKSGLE
jgi:multiple sugar transport system substrate-binding protein